MHLLTRRTDHASMCRARQARRALRRARVPGAREVREPLLAHARRRAARQQYARRRPSDSRSRHVPTRARTFHVRARRRGGHRAGGHQRQAAPGQAGYITQALGGSFTVYVEGNLFRIAGKDADALGKEAAAADRTAAGRDRRGCPQHWSGTRCGPATTRRSRSTSSISASCTSATSQHEDDGRACQREDDADRARLRHGRSAGAGREGKGRGDPDRQREGMSSWSSIRRGTRRMMSEAARLQTGMM